MDFEKLHKPDLVTTPEYLLDICQRFADILARGQWFLNENREVSISRSFTEVIGSTLEKNVGGEKVTELRLKTTASFTGGKEIVNEYDDGGVETEEFYTITAVVGEALHYSALPERVLSELAMHTQVMDEDDEENGVYQRDGLTAAVLEAFTFEHEYEISYVIDEDGEYADYVVIDRYKADDEVLVESRYGWNDADERSVVTGTALGGNGEPLEYVTGAHSTLQESDIAQFLENFDKVVTQIMESEEFDTLGERAYGDGDNHARQVVGIIALAASGFKGIKL